MEDIAPGIPVKDREFRDFCGIVIVLNFRRFRKILYCLCSSGNTSRNHEEQNQKTANDHPSDKIGKAGHRAISWLVHDFLLLNLRGKLLV